MKIVSFYGDGFLVCPNIDLPKLIHLPKIGVGFHQFTNNGGLGALNALTA